MFRAIIHRWRHLGCGDPSKSTTVAQRIKLKLKCTLVLEEDKDPGKATSGWFEQGFTFWSGLVKV